MTTLSTKLTYYIPYSHSLKEKRMVSRSLIDRVRHKFNVSVSEVDTQDSHQTLTVGIAVVSGSAVYARTMLDNIVRYMESSTEAELLTVEDQDYSTDEPVQANRAESDTQ